MTTMDRIPLTKFNGSDFALWRFQLEVFLGGQELMDVLDDNDKVKVPTGEEKKAWEAKDRKVKAIIVAAVESNQLRHLLDCKTALEMYTRLKSLYGHKSATSVLMVQAQFHAYKMGPNDSMLDHIAAVTILARQLEDLGKKLTDSDIIAKILFSLPPKYRHILSAWDATPEKDRTLDELTARLLKEESLQKMDSNDTDEQIALIAQRSRKPQKNSGISKGSKGTYMKDKRCHYCGIKGHFKAECRKRKRDMMKSDKHEQANVSTNIEGAFSVTSETLTENTAEDWFLDSGASHHMSNRKEWFENFVGFQPNERTVQVGNDEYIPVLGSGNIRVLTLVDNKWEPHVLLDVLYVPKICKNLFSLSAAISKGNKLVADHKLCKLVYRGKMVAEAVKTNGNLYKLLMKTTDLHSANSAESGVTFQIWHERLGHIGKQKLQEMIQTNAVSGIRNIPYKDFFCVGCAQGKMHRESHLQSHSPRSNKPGNLMYFDIAGPMSVPSLGGSRYFLLVKDDATSYCFIYFLKHKSEAVDKIRELIAEVSAAGHKLRRVRSDNAPEFISAEMRNLFRKKFIKFENSSPYCPQQMGRIERQNRTVVEDARTLLHSAQLPLELWAEMCHTAVYLRNRVPIQRINGRTPFELWSRKLPEVSHLRIIGSEAYVLIQEQFRQKLEAKSERHILVGYQNGYRSYRLWLPGTNKIIISGDVSINEGKLSNKIVEVPIIKEPEKTTKSEQEVKPKKKQVFQREPYELRSKKQGPATQVQVNATPAIALYSYSEPNTYEEAMHSPDKEQWEQAMNSELDSLKKNETWQLVELPSGRRSIKNKWVFKVKTKPSGEIERYKARLVIKGCSQIEGIDYTETFSPVVKYTSLRVLLSIAASNNLEICQFDIKTAFLNGDLDEEIFMDQPEGYNDGSSHVCKLTKSLYGLKQAPRQWNKKFDNFLKSYGLKATEADQCIYVNKQQHLYLALYVDDGLAVAPSKELIEKLLQEMREQFEITVSSAEYFLGLQLDRDRDKKTIHIHQEAYIKRILKRFNMSECNKVSVPVDPHVKLNEEMFPKQDEEKEDKNKFPYRELIGSLMYLAIGSRPDLAYAVTILSQYLEKPHILHWEAAKRVLKFLKGTMRAGITFCGSTQNKDVLIGYSDADFAGCEDTRRSRTGIMLMLNGGPIHWISRKQGLVTKSTTEAEYVAASEASSEIIWARRLLKDMGHAQNLPTLLYCDNIAAISLVQNPNSNKRTKYIDVHYHYIREKNQEGTIKIQAISSKEQIADILTKALAPDKFKSICGILNLA
ncbi:gag-pol polyprotein-like protein [Dinothrombium tinctorium]|uniref:Gag-pol polyprotein-like protein n=1 Tax=Dinothrombium tinctorium TaxID=1965070 RepID=A0A443QGC7_9ACAR|nr:gag-pol polyprotein-like protein [Dinothrombium tinctorium]